MTQSTPIPGLRLVILLIAVGLGVVLWQLAFKPIFQPVGANADMAERDWPDMRLDLNRATAAELTLLPGIGPKMAMSMVEDRKRNGPFATVDDLARVHRIGPKTIEKLRPFVVVPAPGIKTPASAAVKTDPAAAVPSPPE